MKTGKNFFQEVIFLSTFPIILSVICIVILSIQFIYSKIPPYWYLGFSSVIEEQVREWKNFEIQGLQKSQKIQHNFTASENNLGIVLVRFYNFNRINSDKVVFRFKENTQKDWYYVNSYKVDQFQPNAYFTFGFPVINNSKNKNYYFEIESLNGKPNNSIALSKKNPSIGYVYKFSKNDLTRDKNTLLFFIQKKILYSLNNINYMVVIVAYFISLITVFSYKYRKQLLKQSIAFLNKFELSLKKINKRYSKKINSRLVLLFNYYLRNNKKLIIPAIIFIFLTAVLMRISFYWNPLNFENEFIWSHLGGHGDYDNLFRHAVRFMVNNDLTAIYWGASNDFPFLIRFYSLLFNLFGFVKGLDYSVYFFTFLSSLVCLVPFIISSRLKKFVFGGFTASLLLAVNSLPVWLASGRIIDTLTSFFFSIFIILFFLALEKRNFLIALLLGVIAVIDSHNRGMMLLNNAPALFLFGIYYLIINSKKINSFPFFRFRFKDLIYAFLPLFILLVYYVYMNVFFITVFKRYWAFGFWGPLPKFDSVSASAAMQGSKSIIDKLSLGEWINYFLVFNLGALFEYVKVIKTEILFSLGLILFSFIKFVDKYKKLHYKWFLIPVLYIGFLYLVQKLLTIQPYFKLDLGITSLRYFFRITEFNFLLAFILLEFTIMQILILKRDFIKLILTILPYFFLLGYGYYISFSERHFIQILVVFFMLYGLTIDKLLIPNRNFQIKTLGKIFSLLIMIIIYGYVGSRIFQGTMSMIGNFNYYLEETKYLQYAKTLIPEDGIILVGMKRENPILISNHTERQIIYNIGTSDGYVIKPGKKYFSIPLYEERFAPYIVSTGSKNDVVLRCILADENEFKKYKFYVLDYNIERWNELIANKRSGFPSMKPETFFLEKVNKNNRPIYKLSLKNTNTPKQ